MPQGAFFNAPIVATVGQQYTPISGWAYEFLPWPAEVKILCSADKALGTIQVYSGSESIVDTSPVSIGTINVFPNDLNTHPIMFHAPAGDRLRVIQTQGTASTQFQMIVIVNPVG
ncbi:MAG: hypothetical protein NTU93_00035 [Arthrobacter sp.]|nr:hypothetical protein [Arthrobacter sp.]